jgi:hypothetical protein
MTLRAYSRTEYWNPPQVPTKGQLRVRAKLIPASMPAKLL